MLFFCGIYTLNMFLVVIGIFYPVGLAYHSHLMTNLSKKLLKIINIT